MKSFLQKIGRFFLFEVLWAATVAMTVYWLGDNLSRGFVIGYTALWAVFWHWLMLIWWMIWGLKPAIEQTYKRLVEAAIARAVDILAQALEGFIVWVQSAPLERIDEIRQRAVDSINSAADSILNASEVEDIRDWIPPALIKYAERWMNSLFREKAQQRLIDIVTEIELQALFGPQKQEDLRKWLRARIDQEIRIRYGDQLKVLSRVWLGFNIVFAMFAAAPAIALAMINWIAG